MPNMILWYGKLFYDSEFSWRNRFLNLILTTCVACKNAVPPFGFSISVYIEVGDDDSATVAFTFADVDSSRSFEIKVTQFTCDSEMRPPEGCLQYHMGIDGSLQTFNFANDDVHLADQQYNICIRKEMGN